MEDALRPAGLGATQWYVLYHLAHNGPTMQSELVRMLQVERSTLSAIVRALVGRRLIEQVPHPADQRQKRLRLTSAGSTFWHELPDLGFIQKTAFEGIGDADIATTVKVLRIAVERLENLIGKRTEA